MELIIICELCSLCVLCVLFPVNTRRSIASSKFDKEVLSREIRRDLNIDGYILCFRVLVNLKVCIFLYDATRSLVVTEEVMDVLGDLRLDGRSPDLHSVVVAVVLEDLAYPIKHTHDGIFLQSLGGSIVQSMVGECHCPAVLLDHRNHPEIYQSGDL